MVKTSTLAETQPAKAPTLPSGARTEPPPPRRKSEPPAAPVLTPLAMIAAADASKKTQRSKSIEQESAALSPSPVVPTSLEPGPATPVRSARLRKKQLVSTIAFYVVFILVVLPLLFFLGLHFSSETSIRGQVIPPAGMLLSNEVWVVSDFRELAAGVADDLAAERAPKLQEIQERQEHVQRAQADIAAREERIRLLQDQITGAKDEIGSVIKQARDASQKVWDGPGASLENEYKNRLAQLQQSIAARATSLNLKYTPDDTYQSPEVWANAYRLALYQTPPGIDGAKEHTWIEDQLVQWRAFTKTFDDRKDKLRLQAAQILLSPTARVNDLNGQIDDLQHRVDSTQAEEEPLKTELQQARTDLAQSQAAEAHLDDAYYQQLYKLPEQSITKRLPMRPDGRFDWTHLEKDSAFSSSDKSHTYWIFSRAVRKDGRQFWMLDHFSISQNSNLAILIDPGSFISTKAILRPDLSADDQQE